MEPRRLLTPDRIAGAAVALIGAAALAGAAKYGIGTFSNIGPGALPAAASAILLLCGLAMCLPNVADIEALPPFAWRPVLAVLGSIAVWAFVTLWFGLVAGSIALALVASLAIEHPRWIAALVTGTILGVGGAVLFVRLLGIPLPIFNWF